MTSTSSDSALPKVASTGLASAIALLTTAAIPTATLAQITPDDTLGTENSVLVEGIIFNGQEFDLIDGGAERGSNLFHSFLEFNIDDGQRVYFINPLGIENILSRVTGGDPSNLLGTLGVAGPANLFFLNPNGIVFGPNATLDVIGSFVGTTADAIQLGDQGFFSATEPEAPGILTIAPSALWFNQIDPGDITNNSVAPLGFSASGLPLSGLQAPTDRSLLLVGGDINMAGGRIIGSGSNIEIGGLAEPGSVGLETTGNFIQLIFPENALRSDINLADDGLVGLIGRGGGSITAYANRLTATNGGRLIAVIEGAEDGSNITVDANQIELSGIGPSLTNSGFLSRVLPTATGDAGSIDVTAASVNVQNGAQISSTTFGAGDAGAIVVTADDITVVGVDENAFFVSGIGSTSETLLVTGVEATGDAGDVTVSSRTLSVRDGGRISTETSGQGVGGTLLVTASESTELIGSGNLVGGFSEAGEPIFTANSSGLTTETFGTNAAGKLKLVTGQLLIQDGAGITASTFGTGAAGDVEVIADTIDIVGVREDQQFVSTIRSVSRLIPGEDTSAGAAGNVAVSTQRLSLRDGGQISTETASQGLGGRLLVTATESTELVGSGITATGVTETGDLVFGESSSGLNTQTTGTANAGILRLDTGALSIRDGAIISASTFGAGNAGELKIVADSINLSGVRADRASASSIQSISGAVNAQTFATGNAGDISITAQSLNIQDGSSIRTTTAGEGVGGDLSLTVRESATLTGGASLTTGSVRSQIATGTLGSDRAGDLNMTVGRVLTVADGAGIFASTSGSGAAGDVQVSADLIEVVGVSADRFFFSDISSTSVPLVEGAAITGAAGDVTISSRQLSVRDGGQISAGTASQGPGGTLTVTATESTELVGSGITATGVTETGDLVFGESSSGLNTQTTGTANAGDLRLETGALSIRDGATINASTFGGSGNAGDIEIIADAVSLSGIRADRLFSSNIQSIAGTTLDRVSGTGNAGNILVTTDNLTIRDGGAIRTTTFGEGEGGNLNITVNESAELTGSTLLATGPVQSSVATGTGGSGSAGDLSLTVGETLRIREGAGVVASTEGSGAAGNVQVSADLIEVLGVSPDGFFLSDISSTSRPVVGGDAITGDAGDVTISSRRLSVRDGGQISTETASQGLGGRLSITATESTELVGSGMGLNGESASSGLYAQTTGPDDAGDLQLETGVLAIRDGATIDASTFGGSGNAGDIEITADAVSLSGIRADRLFSSNIQSIAGTTLDRVPGTGNAGNILVTTDNLTIRDGGVIRTTTVGEGDGGNLDISVNESAELTGSALLATGPVGSTIATGTLSFGRAGDLSLSVGETLRISEGAGVLASTFGAGDAGEVEVLADTIEIIGVGADELFASSIQSISGENLDGIPATGGAGNVKITAQQLQIADRGFISTVTVGDVTPGDIQINVRGRLEMNDGDISTTAFQAAGGDIAINTSPGFGAGIIVLRGDSDITTSSQRDGGNITILGGAIVAFDDSDILTTSEDGTGGDITLGNFFSEVDPFAGTRPFDGNDRVDVNAEGRVASGNISTPDVSVIENNLTDLSGDILDTAVLTAGSCIVRVNNNQQGSFIVTGFEGLPQQPSGDTISAFPTGTVQAVAEPVDDSTVQEPAGIFQLADGRLVLSHECGD